MRAKVFLLVAVESGPTYPIPSLLSAWKTTPVCTYRENELKEDKKKKMSYLVFIVFSLGPLIEYTIGLKMYAINIDLKNPKLPINCDHSFCLLFIKTSFC